MSRRWKWRVQHYYGSQATSPRKPGELAIETVHSDDPSLYAELRASMGREDIGQVVINRET